MAPRSSRVVTAKPLHRWWRSATHANFSRFSDACVKVRARHRCLSKRRALSGTPLVLAGALAACGGSSNDTTMSVSGAAEATSRAAAHDRLPRRRRPTLPRQRTTWCRCCSQRSTPSRSAISPRRSRSRRGAPRKHAGSPCADPECQSQRETASPTVRVRADYTTGGQPPAPSGHQPASLWRARTQRQCRCSASQEGPKRRVDPHLTKTPVSGNDGTFKRTNVLI